MIRLRPHHLLCVLTFVGEGYTPAFVANLDALVARLAAGESIELVDGPDDVCAPLGDGGDDHCRRPSVGRRDRNALLALAAAGLVDDGPLRFDAPRLAAFRAAFAAGTVRDACGGCPWNELCSGIAARDFRDARLVTPPG